jgi:hypothetical protein
VVAFEKHTGILIGLSLNIEGEFEQLNAAVAVPNVESSLQSTREDTPSIDFLNTLALRRRGGVWWLAQP